MIVFLPLLLFFRGERVETSMMLMSVDAQGFFGNGSPWKCFVFQYLFLSPRRCRFQNGSRNINKQDNVDRATIRFSLFDDYAILRRNCASDQSQIYVVPQ